MSAFLFGCASGNFQSPPPESAVPYTQNQILKGDMIEIDFPGATNLNTVLRVPLDGSVKLPFAGEYQTANKTPQQLQEEILADYGPNLQVKEVDVRILQSSAAVFVSGAVLSPGRIPLDRPLTALEAVAECGGFDPTTAKASGVTVVRMVDGRQVTYGINLKKAMSGKDPTPFYLKPSDIVNVPTKTFNL